DERGHALQLAAAFEQREKIAQVATGLLRFRPRRFHVYLRTGARAGRCLQCPGDIKPSAGSVARCTSLPASDATRMQVRFAKMHGLGNDFMVVDWPRERPAPEPDVVRRLADRRFGVGFD